MNIDIMFVKLRGVGPLLLVNPIYNPMLLGRDHMTVTDGVSEQYIERTLAVRTYPKTIIEVLRFSSHIKKWYPDIHIGEFVYSLVSVGIIDYDRDTSGTGTYIELGKE